MRPRLIQKHLALLLGAAGLCLGVTRLQAVDTPFTAEGTEFFERKIRPVLAAKCYKCHSAGSEKLKGGLYLDSREGMLKGGNTGPAILPGAPEKSLLIKAIHYDDPDLQMPPKEELTEAQQRDFEAWIKMGAPAPPDPAAPAAKPAYDFVVAKKFWSFQPLRPPPLPVVKRAAWIQSPIDHFILARLEQGKLQPAPAADRLTLIRRATFDLTGLPPTPAEVDSFLQDPSPNAFEKVVDHLLASPRYGERWGRHWLDVVRYADTSGCNSDYPVSTAYKYRNYVIDAFNHDKPYDTFLREQIAGDLLPSKNNDEKFEKIVATGYLAIARRFGSRASEFHLTIEDIIDNLGKGMLGLSVSCARCHDHKFDPIPNRDYYALYGIFGSTRFAFPGTEIYKHPKDFVPLAAAEETREYFEDNAELADLDSKIEKLLELKKQFERVDRKITAADPPPGIKPVAKAAPTGSAIAQVEKERKDEVKLPEFNSVTEIKAALDDARTRQKLLEGKTYGFDKAYAVSEGAKIGNARIQRKGEPANLGEEAPRGFLEILGGQQLPPTEHGSGRLELAQWISDPKNPLTARVMVNRIWQHHFGRGLVQTPNDFGARGKPPTHPELLDYLASRFIEGGWSIKKMHKLLMLSQSYQLSSQDNPKNAAIDAANDLLWKFNRRRLDAEEIRDAIMFVAGTLDFSMPGPHPFPPENEYKFTQHRPFVASYETSHRSVYLMQQRIKKQPFLEVFDGADPNAATAIRSINISPLQALFLLNDKFAHEQADKLAVRVGMAQSDDANRIDYAFRVVLGRPATTEDIHWSRDYLQTCLEALRQTDVPTDQQPRAALASYMRVLLSSSEFLFVD